MARERELWPSTWREFIEARDAVAMVLSMPLTPRKLVEQGGELMRSLAMPKQERRSWLQRYELASEIRRGCH